METLRQEGHQDSAWTSQGDSLPPSAQQGLRTEGGTQDASWPPYPRPLTILNGAVGQEVLDGVRVQQPHASALGRHAVLHLLLLRPRRDLLQLHLWVGVARGCSGQVS